MPLTAAVGKGSAVDFVFVGVGQKLRTPLGASAHLMRRWLGNIAGGCPPAAGEGTKTYLLNIYLQSR